MQFNLSYNEVVQLILEKTGKELPISYGGPHTLRISYKVPLMGAVGLDVNVDRINGSDIFLSYGGGAGIEFMVRQALNMARNRPGGDMIEPLSGNRLMICLGKNAQAGSLLDHVTLRDIRFDEQYIIIEFVPKTN